MIHDFTGAQIYKLRIVFATNRNDWNDLVKWYGSPNFKYPMDGKPHLAAACRVMVKGYSPVIIVVANMARLRREGAAVIADTCAHESTHVMRYVCENVGDQFLGWEAEACLVGALAGWMYKIIVDGTVN